MKPNDGRYGSWAGNQSGRPEDKTRCVEVVWNQSRGMISSQCSRKRGYGPDGKWCKQHTKKQEAK